MATNLANNSEQSDLVRGLGLWSATAISAPGALHVVVLTGARIPYAMARNGVFFQFAERIHPSFRTPSGALLFLGFIAALLALSGTFEELYSLFVFAVWIFFALTAIALLRLRKKEPDLPRPYRAWGYPWTPIVFLIRSRPCCELVDGPACALLVGPGSYFGGHSILLQLAQVSHCRGS